MGQIFRQALPTSSQGSLPASSEIKDPTEVFTVECCLRSKYSVNASWKFKREGEKVNIPLVTEVAIKCLTNFHVNITDLV